MRHSSTINASLILRVNSIPEDKHAPTMETRQHDITRLLRDRLTALEAALRRVAELQHEAAKATLRLRCSVTDQIMQDVPSDIEVCEFDCRRSQCTLQEWETCGHRLHLPLRRPTNPSII